MAVRWYVACAAVATFVFLAIAAFRADLVPKPWQPAPEAGLRSALLNATWSVDLETGAKGTPQADLHWGMAARDQPYLGVLPRGTAPGALLAETGDLRWEQLDATSMSQLSYAPNRFSAWGPDAPVHKGALFAVRTAEGNFAKVRIADIGRDYQLRLEWLVYGDAKGPVEVNTKQANTKQVNTKQAANANATPEATVALRPATSLGPSLTWLALRDEALADYKAQRMQDALDACERAVSAAKGAGAPQHALALVTCGGLTGLHRRAASQMEDWLRQGVTLAGNLDQQAIVAALGPQEALLKERALRMLGILYRDQGRSREAMQNFALAVDAVRAMPPPETGEQRLALRSDLYELGMLLSKSGMRGTARKALGESREYYLKTEPDHPMLRSIDEQLKRLEDPLS